MGKKIGRIICALMALAAVFSCTKAEQEVPEKPAVPAEVLGTYSFDGKDYDILSVRHTDDGTYLMFTFSPLPDSGKMTTYAAFGIRLYWLDKEVDIKDVNHNDDYVFVYEDPVRYYSQYRRPVSGKYMVKKNKERNYTVNVELTLADGTPFSMDFTGDF